MFQYDYAGRRPIEAYQSAQIPNGVSPSFKPEFGNTDYYSLSQGQYLQQHLLRMGFKFRDIPGVSASVESPPRFQPQTTRGGSGYLWNSGDISTGPAPIFRPLSDVDLKKIERVSGSRITPVPAVAAPYGLTGGYSDYLSDYVPVGPVFRPIP